MGLEKVLLTCDKNNTASSKVIVRGGGVLENEITGERNGVPRVTQRYWITVADAVRVEKESQRR